MIRRHALVSAAVFVVVVAVGIVYVRRQVPTFRATAQLLVEKRPGGGARDLPEAVSFMEDATYAATQRYLLKHDEDLAREVLRRMGEEPTDGRVGALLSGIRVAPEPGTLVIKLSFEGPDPSEAVRIVNLYAEEYVEKNRDKRTEVMRVLLEDVNAQYELAASRERKAALVLEKLRRDHPEIGFASGENPARGLAQQLNGQAITDDLRLIDLERERGEIEGVLSGLEVRVQATRSPDGEETLGLAHEGTREELEDRLRKSPEVLGLPVISRSDNVADLRSEIRNQKDRLQGLRIEFQENHSRVREVKRQIAEGEEMLGSEIRTALERFLRDVVRRRLHLEEVQRRYERASERARKTNELLAAYREGAAEHDEAAAEAIVLRERKADLEKKSDAVAGQQLDSITLFKEAAGAPLVRPNKMLIYLLTGMAAVFLAVGAAALLGYLDDTIKTKEDFDRQFGERLPFIGFVPRISAKEFRRPDLVTFDHPHAAVAEAFRSVRTSILLSRSGEELQSLLVTSASPGEGKTTVSINLAITMARGGGSVLLVDADLRRSRIHRALGLDRAPGLTSVLTGAAELSQAIQKVRLEGDRPNGSAGDALEFDVLTSGELPPNPSELLGSPAMTRLLDDARERYGKVVLDTPPLVAVTDACVLSSRVDGVFTVMSVGKTSWRLIRSGLEDLEKVHAPIRGAILNSLSSAGGGYGYYDSYRYRSYRYGPEEKPRETARSAT
jgi:succinoglycan biosynthesis transport protein ExoP